MSRLLFFHDFVSPYCRLALESVTEAAERTGLEVRPVPVELWPAPEPLPDPSEGGLTDALETARTLAEEWGVALERPPRVPRTRKAHETVAYTLEHGATIPVLRRIYEALWSDGRDISRIDVLADLGEAAGLEREPLHVALGLDRYQADVVREQHAAAGAEITGVPAVQLGSVLAAGLHPADELVGWIEQNR
ncbi:MAG: DsbA family protein [Longimicrobiales bacterium]|nr:DsbA family protein [Longimicrobiales bacterium]